MGLFPKHQTKSHKTHGKERRVEKKSLLPFGRPKTKKVQKKFLGIFAKGK
jgi:hypothetical protein